jgi:hypothetical protein
MSNAWRKGGGGMDDKLVTGTFDKIKQWHQRQHVQNLRSAFELGDLILNAVIMTGLNEHKVIQRIIKELDGAAYCPAIYKRSAQIARVYNAGQRAVLLDKGLPLLKTHLLAGKVYDNRERTQIIDRIKRGEIKNWNTIKGALEEKKHREARASVQKTMGRSEALRIAINEIESIREKYDWLIELEPMFTAFDAAKKKIEEQWSSNKKANYENIAKIMQKHKDD